MSRSALRNKSSCPGNVRKIRMAACGALAFAALLSCLVFSGEPVSAEESFYIKDYKVDVRTGLDRGFDITETITVDFTSQLHGIIRSIPKPSPEMPYAISGLNVEGDPFSIEYDSGNVDLRIGSADRYVSGIKTYTIRYRLLFPKDTDTERDIAYLNLIGTGWDTRIENAEMTFHFPEDGGSPVRPSDYAVYSGYFGDESDTHTTSVQDADRITIGLTQPLSNYEGITLYAVFPEGTFRLAGTTLYPYEMTGYKSDILVASDKAVRFRESFSVRINDFSEPSVHSIPGSAPDGSYYDVRDIRVNGIRYPGGKNRTSYDVPLSGDGAYTVEYTIQYPYDSADEKRSLHLQLFGALRPVPLDAASIAVSSPFMPSAAAAGFTSDGGSGGTIPITPEADGTLRFEASSALAPAEGIFIDISYPDGSFGFLWAFPYLAILFMPILLLVLAYLLFLRFGRDETVSPVIEFYPPDGLSSGALGYVINRIVDPADMSSMLLYWASHGHILFTATSKRDFTIAPGTPLDDAHPFWEQNAFSELQRIFAGSGDIVSKSTLETEFYRVTAKMKSAIPLYFKNGHRLDDSKAGKISALTAFLAFIYGFLLTAITVYRASSDTTLAFMGGMITSLGGLFVFGLVFLISAGWYKRSKIRDFFLIAAISAAVLIGSLIYTVFMQAAGVAAPIPLLLFNVLSLAAVQSIAVFIRKRSTYGQRLLERVVGFREFLIQAEKERLEALLDEDPEYYYHILPYALVLGVSDIWEDKFRDIPMTQPGWYDGGYGGYAFSYVALTSLARSASTDMARHTAPPSSSGGGGFSGGGFSGGGGGGGGGSGW